MTDDTNAIMPYARPERFRLFTPETTKLYVVVNPGKTNEEKQKVTIRTWGASAEEDVEHFFEFFDIFINEMSKCKLWDNANTTQAKDVTHLFNHFSECIRGNARTDWFTTLGGPTPAATTWLEWKKKIPEYIMTQVLPEDAFRTQRNYLYTRHKPANLSFTQWWKRVQTLNRYLVFMIDRSTMEEWSDNKVKELKQLWEYGSYNQTELKTIMIANVPKRWKNEFEASALTWQADISKLVTYFQKAEARESERIQAQRRIPRGSQRDTVPRYRDDETAREENNRREDQNGSPRREDQIGSRRYYNDRNVPRAPPPRRQRYNEEERPNDRDQRHVQYGTPRRPEAGRGYGRGRGPPRDHERGGPRDDGRRNDAPNQPREQRQEQQQYYGNEERHDRHHSHRATRQDYNYYASEAQDYYSDGYDEEDGYYAAEEYHGTEEDMINDWNENLWLDIHDSDEEY